MKNQYNIVVFEASEQDWDEWRVKYSSAKEKTKSALSAIAITGAAGAWLSVLYKLLQKNRVDKSVFGQDKVLLTVSSLAAAAGVWHFYKMARKIVDKREATQLAYKFANHKAQITKDKEDIERAKKWEKRRLKLKK